MQVLEGPRGLEDDLERERLRERPLAIEPLERGLSVHELHDEVVQPVDGVMVEAAHEGLVLELAEESHSASNRARATASRASRGSKSLTATGVLEADSIAR